ncbi:hypothetical protein DQ237_03215 [Blastococcus sp. TF02-8]|uniref:hypothetical protein n=1 Tax=Blastococcus sp. TF02-8 TaxID=2250574 RepID=UPI000DEB5AFF|nr:hypothetical protein [Blastococcus sp. TF02-8]RBY97918.1 hypothetical protein DQ237_03215 [Blastococcus sp. TF02-8]
MTVLVVDVANVVGSRPDGWWRDRAGAATRLLGELASIPGELSGPDGRPVHVEAVVAVVEGAARDVPAPHGVRVVRASGSGDDALVCVVAEMAGDAVVVVTADRGLRARLPAATPTAGPRWLRDRLDEVGGMGPGGTG